MKFRLLLLITVILLTMGFCYGQSDLSEAMCLNTLKTWNNAINNRNEAQLADVNSGVVKYYQTCLTRDCRLILSVWLKRLFVFVVPPQVAGFAPFFPITANGTNWKKKQDVGQNSMVRCMSYVDRFIKVKIHFALAIMVSLCPTPASKPCLSLKRILIRLSPS